MSQIYREIDILKQLRHPNILTFMNSFTIPEKNRLVFITEIMTSGTLKQCALKYVTWRS